MVPIIKVSGLLLLYGGLHGLYRSFHEMSIIVPIDAITGVDIFRNLVSVIVGLFLLIKKLQKLDDIIISNFIFYLLILKIFSDCLFWFFAWSGILFFQIQIPIFLLVIIYCLYVKISSLENNDSIGLTEVPFRVKFKALTRILHEYF